MRTLNFIGGEKGGVGKSVLARVLAQYFIDRGHPFTGFDTDRSHASFARFYGGYAAPIVVDSYSGLDAVVGVFEDVDEGAEGNVIVDLAAQTAAPLARWIGDSDLLTLLREMGVAVNFWHLADSGRDAVDLLERLLATYGEGPNYIVVKNLGRGSDFSYLDHSPAMQRARALGGKVMTLPQLHESSMNKIDHQNTSFWAAVNLRDTPEALSMLERQRVKTWLKSTYAAIDALGVV